MPINDRVMTPPRARSSAALRVAVSGAQAVVRGAAAGRPPVPAARGRLSAGHDNLTCPIALTGPNNGSTGIGAS